MQKVDEQTAAELKAMTPQQLADRIHGATHELFRRIDPGSFAPDPSSEPIETINDQMVGVHDSTILVISPKQRMTPEEALRHAAWLVAVVGDTDRFQAILQAVFNT